MTDPVRHRGMGVVLALVAQYKKAKAEVTALREQLAEANDMCMSAYSSTASEVLEENGALKDRLAARDGVCRWTCADDDGMWSSACGHDWIFPDGVPTDNQMVYCPMCGKRGEWVPHVPPTDDDDAAHEAEASQKGTP